MPETFDEYADAFLVTTGMFGGALTFRRSEAVASQANPVQLESIGVIRMSLEHLKAMAFIMHRQILDFERRNGINVPMSISALNQMNIAPEDWDKFWRRTDG